MARQPPAPQQAVLTPDRMRQGIQRLERCILEVKAFDPETIQTSDDTSRADSVSASVDAALVQTFGQATIEYHRYSGATMFNWPINLGEPILSKQFDVTCVNVALARWTFSAKPCPS
jgi:hypothetical protein